MCPGEGDRSVTALRIRRRPVIQRNLQQNHLHRDHDERLDEKRIVEFRTGVVEYPNARVLVNGLRDMLMGAGHDEPQQGCNEHDERNVEGEASAGPCPVHREGLVAVGEDRRENQKRRGKKPRQRRQPSHLAENTVRDVVVGPVSRGEGQVAARRVAATGRKRKRRKKDSCLL